MMQLTKTFFKHLIKIYQLFFSTLFPNSCRFYPSCSNYALQSLEEYSCGPALVLIIKRIIKCHPLHPGGFDPVPKKRKVKHYG